MALLMPQEGHLVPLSKELRDDHQALVPMTFILPRTCYDILLSDPINFKPGSYRIDPMGLGADSIPVTCNADGTTLVSHDSEAPTTITNCVGVACYNKVVIYPGAAPKQLDALTSISSTCRQSFKYECTAAPFEYNGVQYSYWNDVYGNVKDYWAGPKSISHICQCGIDRNCIQVGITCYITDKEALPLSTLHFGRSFLSGSSGRYTLGKLECSGRSSFTGKPTRCQDLYKIGHVLNGFYPVKSDEKIDMIYCDFALLSDPNGGLETRVGLIDVKSSPVQFYVQRSTSFSTLNIPIPFEVERLNVGRAMNLASGIFTVPNSGIYYFGFCGNKQASNSTTNVFLRLNGTNMAIAHSNAQYENVAITLQSTLKLKVGDQISLVISVGGINDSGNHHTQFSGFLLQEDIVF